MNSFTAIAIIIGLAATFGIVARKLKQPEILGYIAAGIFLSIFLPVIKNDLHSLELFSEIGITFLLFIVGLELDLNEVRKFGSKVFFIGAIQIVLSVLIGFLLSLLLNFNFTESVYIGICLTFSSTIIVIKILSNKGELDTLSGKLSTVFLVLQDFAAIGVMVFLTTITNIKGGNMIIDLLSIVVKGIFLFVLILFFTKILLPFIMKFINRERETLFLSIIAWALLFSALVSSEFIGFSVEVGALLAGIALADRYEHFQIESWMRPLRDFFLTLFFVLLGLQVQVNSFESLFFPIIFLSLFVLILKPTIVFFSMYFFKYSKRVSFNVSISLAQISEFSLLVAALGVSQGKISPELVTLITIVGGITMICSSYLMMHERALYKFLDKIIVLKEHQSHVLQKEELVDHIILLGCHRVGKNILDYIIKQNENVLVVDHNPERVLQLNKSGIRALLGDLRDEHFLENLNIEKSSFVISTIPSMEINKILMEKIHECKDKPGTLFLAKDEEEVAELYDLKADYVVYPYLLTGQKVNMILKNRNNVHKHKISTMKNVLSVKNLGK